MITNKRVLFLSVAASLMFISNTNAQDQALVALDESIKTQVIEKSLTPLLENKQFTYKYQGNDVLVVFSETAHIEYFNNKQHFIKSKILWTSEDSCTMIVQESNLPRFPFKKGDKLKMKITKVKRGFIHYESTLAGRTWTGKMKQL